MENRDRELFEMHRREGVNLVPLALASDTPKARDMGVEFGPSFRRGEGLPTLTSCDPAWQEATEIMSDHLTWAFSVYHARSRAWAATWVMLLGLVLVVLLWGVV